VCRTVNMQVKSKKLKVKSRGGFTLVELLVSSAIFTVVSLVAVGAIITINDANRKTQAIRAIVDNLNYSLESMSRKLRTGSNYQCGDGGQSFSQPGEPVLTACPDPSRGATTMFFTSSENIRGGIGGQTIYYRLLGQDGCDVRDGVRAPTCKGKIQTWDALGNPPAPVDMTPPEVDIKDLRFYVQDVGHPRVLISVAGEIYLEKEHIRTPFHIQTTVTQRLPQ